MARRKRRLAPRLDSRHVVSAIHHNGRELTTVATLPDGSTVRQSVPTEGGPLIHRLETVAKADQGRVSVQVRNNRDGRNALHRWAIRHHAAVDWTPRDAIPAIGWQPATAWFTVKGADLASLPYQPWSIATAMSATNAHMIGAAGDGEVKPMARKATMETRPIPECQPDTSGDYVHQGLPCAGGRRFRVMPIKARPVRLK